VSRQGTPIRDAAVDPRPGDHHPPVNAGLADPHGPLVVSVQPTTLPHGRIPYVDGRPATAEELQP
jgi:hypothetical protein